MCFLDVPAANGIVYPPGQVHPNSSGDGFNRSNYLTREDVFKQDPTKDLSVEDCRLQQIIGET